MRIVSDFHDYYDGIQSYGQDLSVIYTRKTQEFNVTDKPPKIIKDIYEAICPKTLYSFSLGLNSFPSTIFTKTHELTFTKVYILFCGNVHSGVKCTRMKKGGYEKETEFIYNVDAMFEYLRYFGVNLNEKTSRWAKKTFEKAFNDVFSKKIHVDREWCIVNKITNVVIIGNKVIVDKPLKNVDFYRVKDSYTCYQELDMWLSGTLSYPQNFMIDIEDKYKVLEHGFDPKYGFRTRPKEG